MLRQIVLWLLRRLEESLDPDLKARLEQYRRDRAKLEAQISSELEGIAKADTSLAQLNFQRSELEQTVASNEATIHKLKEEVERINAENNSDSTTRRSDADALRGHL